MKKSTIILGVVLLVGVFAAWYYLRPNRPLAEEAFKKFATEEIDEVTRIDLKDRFGNQTSLSKIADEWIVNDQFNINKVGLNDLLFALENMQVAYPVPVNGVEPVITQMIGSSTKVSLYKKNKSTPFKVFHVGGPTYQQDGTYMLMEVDGQTAEKPYVVNLPGFRGYITYRFNPQIDFWVSNEWLSVLPEEIASFSIDYSGELANESYRLINEVDGFSLETNAKKEHIGDHPAAEYFYAKFTDLHFEFFEDSIPGWDTIQEMYHYLDLQVDLKNGEQEKLSIYKKPYPTNIDNIPMDKEGNPLKFDKDKLYAFRHQSQTYHIIQYYVFEELFVKASEF